MELSDLRRRATSGAATWAVLACFAILPSLASAQTAVYPGDPNDDPVFSWSTPFGDVEYVAARGLRLGDSGIRVGGFATIEIDDEKGDAATIALDGPSFLVLWEPVDFMRGFIEFELGDVFTYDTGSNQVKKDVIVDIERLYGEASFNDAVNVRIGKYLTPVGRWNLAPAEPFVWTATKPIMIELTFDEHQTGGALLGSFYPGANTLNYWVYGQFMDGLNTSDSPPPQDRSVGTRLEYESALGDWSLGGSFLASEIKGDWNFLGGLDAYWRRGPFELQSEFVYSEGKVSERDNWGVYTQGVYHLGHLNRWLRGFYGVARYEHFDPTGEKEDVDIGELGLTWLPVPYLNLKVNYRFTDKQTEEVGRGLFASFSVLF